MSKTQMKESTLNDICALVTDGTHDTPKPIKEGIPLIKAKEIVGGIIDFHNCDFISYEDHLKVIARSNPEKGDTLFAHIGASLGEAAFIKTNKEFSIKNIALFKPDTSKIDGRYLYYCIINPSFQNRIKNIKTGAAQPFLSLGHLRTFSVNHHSDIVDQRKIASILSAYDDLIENNTRRIKILEEMAQALYREWFVHFRFPGHEKVRMMDSPLGRIPEGWEAVGYSELLVSNTGGDWGGEEPNNKENCCVAIIRGTDFNDVRYGNNLELPKRYISKPSLIKRKLKENDIIVENSVNAKTRCTGQSLLITKGVLSRICLDSICASFCKVFRLKNPELAPLAYLNLKYLYSEGKMEYYRHVATNGIGNFQATRFLESEYIVLPKDDNLLSQMSKILACLTQSVFADQIGNFRHTRDLLLPKLISGELNLENLELENEIVTS